MECPHFDPDSIDLAGCLQHGHGRQGRAGLGTEGEQGTSAGLLPAPSSGAARLVQAEAETARSPLAAAAEARLGTAPRGRGA